MINVGMVTLGCPKNTVDSEVMLGLLKKNKMRLCSDLNEAEVVVVNTCAFIEPAKKESIDTILRINALKDTARLRGVVVAGCLVSKYKDDLVRELTEADSFIGTGDVHKIVDAVKSVVSKNPLAKDAFFSRNPRQIYDHLTPRVQLTPFYMGYLKISEGCSNACKFCTIPKMRGPNRSRTLESLVEEARQMAERGVVELNVIGQDTTDYGTDIYGKPMLPELLRRLAKVEGIRWIRLFYAFPAHVTDELLDVLAEEEKICRYLDMPVQHLDDELLLKMGRKLDGKGTIKLIEKMRRRLPGLALRTTLIVGLPGETEEKYKNLLKKVKELKFERLGVFTYSDEEHALSSRLDGKVSEKIKKERQKEIMLAQQEVSRVWSRARVGETFEMLMEEPKAGRSIYDAPEIDGKVYLKSGEAQPGSIIRVKVVEAKIYDLVVEPTTQLS